MSGLPADPAGSQLLQLGPPLDAGPPGAGEALHSQDLRQQCRRPEPARHPEGRHA